MSAGENASIVSSVNGDGDSTTSLPRNPLSAKESGAYDHLEASETLRYIECINYLCVANSSYSVCENLSAVRDFAGDCLLICKDTETRVQSSLDP
jgi:hypothetical protein